MSGTTTTPTPAPDDPTPFLMTTAPVTPSPYPKAKWHPVHGKITLPDAATEAKLVNPSQWFDSPEAADAHRTADEAWLTHQAMLTAKLKSYADATPAAQPVVQDSNQSAAQAEAAAAAAAAAAPTGP